MASRMSELRSDDRPIGVDVLVVDDDRTMLRVITRILEQMGHRCTAVESAEDAMRSLAERRVDLVITDVNMAGLSGLELVELARRADPDVAVVVVSGVDDVGTAESALAGGAFGYIVKPFEMVELQIAVSNALRRRDLERAVRQHLEELEDEVDRRTAELRRTSEELELRVRRFASLAQSSPAGILYAKRDGTLEYCNSTTVSLLGRPIAELAATRWLDEISASARGLLEEAIQQALAGVPDVSCEYNLERTDGSVVWLHSRVAPVLDDEHRSTGLLVLFEDISTRKQLEHQLRQQASHDHLTALPNRRAFRSRLEALIPTIDEARPLAVFLIDVDQFKLINDTYGHEAGDQLIITVAERLSHWLPPGATVARLGGDEFIVAVTAHDRHALTAMAEDLRSHLRQPVRVLGVELSMSTSIGVAIAVDPQTTASGMLRAADIAMHEAKGRRDVVALFDTAMASDVARRLALTSELRKVVDAELLEVHYQPIVDASSGQLTGLEALARWTHQEWGRVDPVEFIPIAESTGLAHEIDRQVLTAAIGQLGQWRRAGRVAQDVFVSVNLSASQLANQSLPTLIDSALGRAGVPPSVLCLEITETTLICDLDRTVPMLERLRARGIRIAVDDFGTGRSALSYLGHLPLDVLKIDRAFVADDDRCGIVGTIVDLAHRFGLTVIAEGVEEEQQLERLRTTRCDQVQGYLTGRPTPPSQALGQTPTTNGRPNNVAVAQPGPLTIGGSEPCPQPR